uniref:Peptidase S1 domain-containing protein n=1 Tax=Astyanax mexicanus TaxID=7994 RepID=A0A3B1IIU1_ASTMX
MAPISLLLLVVLLSTSCRSASVKVGIINGTEAEPHSRPYMVSIQLQEQHVCGGFLITDSFVMTAAHCEEHFKENWDKVTAVIGAHNLKDNDFERIAVDQHYIHEHFTVTKDKVINDIMLMKLKKSTENSKNAQSIHIQEKKKARKRNDKCSVAGWGCITTNGNPSDVLMEAHVKIIPPETCKEQWSFYNDSIMLCAGGLHHGFCQGDSGGPLVCNNFAVGIVSFQNKDCDHPQQPNGYTRITGFLPWIKKTIHGTK